jgi:hypothetical protein
MTYDRVRDRVVLFGGYHYAADGKTLEALHDTWEFDGATWTEVQATAAGPDIDKPLLAYNIARNETILVGVDDELATVTYRWDPSGKSWQSVAGETKPPCANEASLSYQTHNERLVFTGGVCGTSTGLTDEVWEFDGATWTKIGGTLSGFGMTRTGGSAYAYDTAMRRLVRYGGTSNFNTFIESSTYVYVDGRWQILLSPTRPDPRSLTTFRRDPARGTIWLFGGLSEFSYGTTIDYTSDLWRYDADGWHSVKFTSGPGSCATPVSAFDTDRQLLVLVCGGSEVWEWNGEEWKSFTPKPTPEFRRFAGLVYDQSIKKTVMFGGYDNINYRDETWTWDGAVWTKLKPSKKPNNRAQMSMWYDPLAKKTFLYSGVGRPNLDERVKRFADMWSFDGTTWTEVTKTADPGIRFGAQVTVDPRDGKVLLFGGLRATIDDKDNVNQWYGNDTWSWDGSTQKWTQVQTSAAPPARQNGALEWDEARGRFVLYGGFAGNLYFSDTWLFDGTTWTPVQEVPRDFRRRGVRQ